MFSALFVLGLILLLVGFFTAFKVLLTIGVILLVVGAVLYFVGASRNGRL